MSEHPDRDLFERFDSLPEGSRLRLLRHAVECGFCRARLLSAEPSRAFALLAAAPLPEDSLERLTAGLGQELDRIAPRRGAIHRFRTAAALAASLALAGFFGFHLLPSSRPDHGGATTVPLPIPALAREGKVPAGGVQLISSPGEAQVLELTIGETQVTMIFDEALDI
jgi:hypothetical protein